MNCNFKKPPASIALAEAVPHRRRGLKNCQLNFSPMNKTEKQKKRGPENEAPSLARNAKLVSAPAGRKSKGQRPEERRAYARFGDRLNLHGKELAVHFEAPFHVFCIFGIDNVCDACKP